MALCSNSTTRTIASSPSLPLELVEEEILCRLPVKKLLQLRCICKSWKSLISDDPEFAKKHLRMSKILNHKHLMVNVLGARIIWESPLLSVFSNVSNHTVTQTQLNIPISIPRLSDYYIVDICSCDGILCFNLCDKGGQYAVLCNPSLRKYTTLPPLENHQKREYNMHSVYSFGYDHFNDVYKVIAISGFGDKYKEVYKEVDVYTLGTNNWRSIQDFPYSSCSIYKPGVFVGGVVNWLAYERVSSSSVIVSLDLKTETYQKISPPDLEKKDHWDLGMFRDCLCIFASGNMFLDVWIMNEYGIKESWTKLYNVPYARNQYIYPKTVYISDDDQVLFGFHDLISWEFKLAVYNSNNGNVNIPKIQYFHSLKNPKVYVESLISLPCCY